jgi:hypothetical protein
VVVFSLCSKPLRKRTKEDLQMKKRSSLVLLAVLAMLLPTLATSTAGADNYQPEATYQVEYRNITSGQYLTPPNFIAHERSLDVFQAGHPASAGVQAVAENGGVGFLAAELAAAAASAGGVSGVGDADGALSPGASTRFEFTTSASRLSVVSMLICTNDGFAGLDGKLLPTQDGQSKTYRLAAYDAGTEVNTENRVDLVPAPFCGEGPGSGASNPALAENGVVRHHRTLLGVGDVPATFDWQGSVAENIVPPIDSWSPLLGERHAPGILQ